MAIVANQIVKSPLWVPGRNDHELWRGCILYLPFWAGVGNRCLDLSVHHNDGTLVGGTWERGALGMGVLCDGDGDRVDCPAIFDIYTNITLCIVADFPPADGGYVWDSTDASERFLLWRAVGPEYEFYASGTRRVEVAMPTTDHKVITATSPQSKLSVDGVLLQDGADGAINTPGNIKLFSRYTDVEALGKIAYAAVAWNRELSPGEKAEFAADPFCMIRHQHRSYFWVGAVGAGAPPSFVPYPYPRGLRGGHSVMTGGLI